MFSDLDLIYFKAFEFAKIGLELRPDDADIQKWYAIALGSIGDYQGKLSLSGGILVRWCGMLWLPTAFPAVSSIGSLYLRDSRTNPERI